MFKLLPEIISYYKENPEMWEVRKASLKVVLDSYVEEWKLEEHRKEIETLFDKLWKNVKSYLFMPEEKDIKELVNKVYKEYRPSDFVGI